MDPRITPVKSSNVPAGSGAESSAPKGPGSRTLDPGHEGLELRPSRRKTAKEKVAGDLESGKPMGIATGTTWRHARSSVAMSTGSFPVTQVVALAGEQFINKQAAGPQSGVKPIPWSNRGPFEPEVPPTSAARLEAAQESLGHGRDYLAMLKDADPGKPVDGDSESGFRAAAKKGGKAVLKTFGMKRAIPQMEKVANLLKSAHGGNVDLTWDHAVKDMMRGKVWMNRAAFPEEAISIEMDHLLKYAEAELRDVNKKNGQALADELTQHVHDHMARQRQFARLDAALAAPGHDDDVDAIRQQHGELQSRLGDAIDKLSPRLKETLPDDWKKHLGTLLQQHAEATVEFAKAERHAINAEARLHRTTQENMRNIVNAPSGFSATHVQSLKDQLKLLADRLMEKHQEPTLKLMPPDQVMENVLEAARQSILNADGKPSSGRTAKALQLLAKTPLERLPDLMSRGDLSDTQADAVRLAAAVGSLPRGAEMLSYLCQTSDFLKPREASDKAGTAAAKEEAALKEVALQYLCCAQHVLDVDAKQPAGKQMPADQRRHIENAKEGAVAMLGASTCSFEALDDRRKHAFCCVRNELLTLGEGSYYHDICQQLAELSGSMLNAASRQKGVKGALAQYMPGATPTPLNPKSLEASRPGLKDGGLIVDPFDAVRTLRDRVEDLAGGPNRPPLQKALHSAAAALMAAVPEAKPEAIAGLTNKTVAMPQYFGLDRADIEREPKLLALWNRYEQRDATIALADKVEKVLPLNDPEQLRQQAAVPANFGLSPAELAQHPELSALMQRWNQGSQTAQEAGEICTEAASVLRKQLSRAYAATPGEVVRELAVLARDTTAASGKSAADTTKRITDFINNLDLARASGAWHAEDLKTPEQLFEAYAGIARTQTLRSRVRVVGSNVYGVDLSKLPLSYTPFGDSAVTPVMRIPVSGKYQSEKFFETGLATTAYYLILGNQKTGGGKFAPSGGASAMGDVGHDISVGGRFADVSVSASGEIQYLSGVRMMIPRDKTTEERNCNEYVSALRQVMLWQQLKHPDVIHAVNTEVPVTSFNLIDDSRRVSKRFEASYGLYPLQVAFPGFQARFGDALRTFGDQKEMATLEATGYFRLQELRADTAAVQQLAHQASGVVRAGSFKVGKAPEPGQKDERGSLNLGLADMASAGKSVDFESRNYALMRLVTVDGRIFPTRSRYIEATSEHEEFQAILDADKARWLQHGRAFSDFQGEGWNDSNKLKASEADYAEWSADMKKHHDRFTEYSSVKCLQSEVAGVMDAFQCRNLLAVRRKDDQGAKSAMTNVARIIGSALSWEPRRASINGRSVQANNPSYVTGVTAGTGGNIEAVKNKKLFPRAAFKPVPTA